MGQGLGRVTLGERDLGADHARLEQHSVGCESLVERFACRGKVAHAGGKQAEGGPCTIVAAVDLDRTSEGVSSPGQPVSLQLHLAERQEQLGFLIPEQGRPQGLIGVVESACVHVSLGEHLERRHT